LQSPGFAGSSTAPPDSGFPGADRVTDHALSLPAHHALSSDDVRYVIEVLTEIFDRL